MTVARNGRVPALSARSSARLTPTPDRVPPFLLLRQVEGDVLVTPFAKRAGGPAPEEASAVQAVAGQLAHDLPVGCFWIDPRDGSAKPAAIAVAQVQRRLLDCTSFQVQRPWRSAGSLAPVGWSFGRSVNLPRAGRVGL